MHTTDSLEHVVGGVARRPAALADAPPREAAGSSAPAFTIAIAREAGAPGTSRGPGRWAADSAGRSTTMNCSNGSPRNTACASACWRAWTRRRQSWLVECMEGFAQHAHIGESGYVRHLTQTILSLGAHGCCVIVGRGAGASAAAGHHAARPAGGDGGGPRGGDDAPARPVETRRGPVGGKHRPRAHRLHQGPLPEGPDRPAPLRFAPQRLALVGDGVRRPDRRRPGPADEPPDPPGRRRPYGAHPPP